MEAYRLQTCWVLVLLAGLIAACVPLTADTPTTSPSPSIVTTTPYPTLTPVPRDTGWSTLHPGVEMRQISVTTDFGDERLTLVRLEPGAVIFRVLYNPGVAYPVSVWARQTGAQVVCNGGFFTEDWYVTGLTISDDAVYGHPYGDFAGMFAVDASGQATVRWLRDQPYRPEEPLQQALQSFPLLVRPGGASGYPSEDDEGQIARRTVIAQDRTGRILILLAPRGFLSLSMLSRWLVASDLALDVALNLDGGTSSGLWVADGPQIDSLVPVPSVLGVWLR